MITETETAFLAVIRAFLTEEKADLAEIQGLTEKQWNHLFVLASRHSLLAAVYDVVGKTPAFLQLSAEFRGQIKMQAMQSVMQQVTRTALFLADEKELEKTGVQPLVMKGIVCRSLYPKPDLRPSGDEDLLIQAKDFAAVDAYFIKKGFVRDKEWAGSGDTEVWKREMGDLPKKPQQSEKPYDSETDAIPEEMGYIHPQTGAFYEIHTSLFSRNSSAYGYLNHAFSNVFEHPSQIEVQGQTIYTLEETRHLFYLLCHSFKHFLHGGVGIRQICDMVQMIRAYGSKIDWKLFWRLCEQYHMTCFCINLLDIGERYLGFSYEESGAVRCTKKIRPDSEALLTDILDAGVFGKSSAGRIHSANITLYAAENGANERKTGTGGVWKSLFPESSYIRNTYPYAAKHPCLIPAAYAQRIFKWIWEQKSRNEKKSSIEVGTERVALLKKYDMIRTAEDPREGKNRNPKQKKEKAARNTAKSRAASKMRLKFLKSDERKKGGTHAGRTQRGK